MEQDNDSLTLNEAVDSALSSLGRNSSIDADNMDDYLRHNVLSLSALENEQSQSDFVSDQSRDLANNAVLKTLSDYQSLMGGGTSGSPQKLATLHSMATTGRSGHHSVSDSDYSSQRTNFAPSSEFDETTMDESQLIQWCFEDEETGDQYINDEVLSVEDMEYGSTDTSDGARYAYVENDDTMIAIDREQLENLVSGRFIPNVSSIIIAQPPSKPDSLPLASTSNNFITDGNNVKTAPSWSYDAEDDDEDEAFPFKSGARKGRFGVGGNTRGGNKNTGTRKVLAGLPEHLKGLLGQANLFRARGNDDEALKLCLEIIRQCPSQPEPFNTVAAIYEANGEIEKAMQFYTISTHLSATDDVIWEKLMQYNLTKSGIDITAPYDDEVPLTLTTAQFDALKETSRCCTRAIIDCRLAEDASNVDQLNRFALIRLQCAEKMGERFRLKQAMRRYLLLLKNHLDPEVYNDLAHKLVGYYFDDKQQLKALEILENLRVFFPQFLTLGDLNILLELFMVAKMYGKCLKVAAKMFKIRLIKEGESMSAEVDIDDDVIELGGATLKISDVEHPKYADISIPSEIHLDIKAKVIVSLIYTGNEHLVEKLVKELLELEDLPEIQDMFYDICDAYREMSCWQDELYVWQSLSSAHNSYANSDDLWLRLGDCYWNLKHYKEAEKAFKKTLDVNPENVQARLNLATYYKDLVMDNNAALDILDVPYGLSDAVKTDVRLVNMRLDLQEASSDLEFFQTIYEIFHYVFTTAKYFKDKDTIEEGIKLPSLGNTGEDDDDVLDVSAQEEDPSTSEKPTLQEFLSYVSRSNRQKFKNLNVQNQIRQRLNVSWDKFHKAVLLGLRLDRKNDVLYIVVMAAQNNVYPDRTRDLHLFASKLGIELKSPAVYYSAKNMLLSENYNSNQAWSLFHLVATFVGDNRPTKHLLHLDRAHPSRSFNKSLFLAVSFLESGSYKMALAELSLHFVQQEKTPLYNFLLGILYLHLGSQRFSRLKGTLFTLAIFFLKRYHIFRDNPQESLYNIGRAFHQIEVLPQAIYYYEKCLLQPAKQADDTGQSYSIHRYAVHNLYRIYMGSGSKTLALSLLKKYPLD